MHAWRHACGCPEAVECRAFRSWNICLSGPRAEEKVFRCEHHSYGQYHRSEGCYAIRFIKAQLFISVFNCRQHFRIFPLPVFALFVGLVLDNGSMWRSQKLRKCVTSVLKGTKNSRFGLWNIITGQLSQLIRIMYSLHLISCFVDLFLG